MKGLTEVAEITAIEAINAELYGRKNIRVPLYYSFEADEVATQKMDCSFEKVTDLLRENSPQEIMTAVKQFMWM